VEVEVLERRGHADPARVLALARLMRRREADLVHSFLVGANVYAYAATRLARLPRFVASSRTSMEIPSLVARRIHSWVFRHASSVIANSEAVADFTSSYYGVARRRLRVVPNGVLPPGAEAGARKRGARSGLGFPPDTVLVGTLGRLSPEKNIPLFLEAAREVSGRFPAARFVVGGDGPERDFLSAEARRLGLEEKLLFAGAQDDPSGFLAALDLFVLTSDTEGLPNAVMEAMGSGIPVVATRVGGTHEVVVDGETGLLVPARNPAALMEALGGLLADAGARRRMGEAGRARIAAHYTSERMIAGTCAVYDEVCGASR